MTLGQFQGFDPAFPPGVIQMWRRPLSEIPRGWVLCDGNNGTPNLLDKFIQGIPNASTEPGASVGKKAVTLSESNLPSHNHSGSTNSSGNHYHEFGNAQYRRDNGSITNAFENYVGSDEQTSINGSHNHSFDSSATGGTSSFDNQPSNTALAYIQKL